MFITTKHPNTLFKFDNDKYVGEIDIPAGTEVEYEKVIRPNGNIWHIIRHNGYELKSVIPAPSDEPQYGAEWVMLK